MTQSTSLFKSIKLWLWRRRMSVSSRRVIIRTRTPWPARILIVAAAFLAGGAVMWYYSSGQLSTATPENARAMAAEYKERLEQVTVERDQLSTTANAAESQLNIERSAQKQLAAQVKSLEAENTRLKEDLAFFESLLPNATGPIGVSIRRLKIDHIAPNQLRYRLLIMQGGKGDRRFIGSLQLMVTTLQDGKSAMMTFPAVPAEQEKFKLSFMHYQRVEGVLTLPEGTLTKVVQARVLENGQVRAQQAANL